jgi:gamma-glutamyltranspeptidase / glutathione hydrolase
MRKHLLVFAGVLALAVLPTGGALAGQSAGRAAGEDLTLSAVALLGNDGTDVYLTVSSASGSVPDRLEKVQLKALPYDGDHLRTENYDDLPAPGGIAVLHVTGLARHRPLQVTAHVKTGSQNNLEADAVILLRPDLTVTESAPSDVVRRTSFTVDATVEEIGGDTGASATATLSDGGTQLAAKPVTVGAGGSTTVSFDAALGDAGGHDLRVALTGSTPAEDNLSNDQATTAVDVHMYAADGVVSTDHWVATKVGEDVLRAGGNAIDAAAAVEFALNVVDPNLTGIGGGSAVLVRLADGDTYAIDGREVAPHATTADMYRGKTATAVGINGYSVGVPATLRTIDEMLKRWGTMSLADVLREPIELADQGAPVGAFLASGSAEARTLDLQPETLAMFRRSDGTPLQVGDTIVQHDLAKTFRLIAENGADAFYTGPIAQAIVDAQKRLSPTKPIAGGQGRMTLADLANLRVTVERPLSLDFDGATVLAPPPSTNGGVVLLEALGLYQAVERANPQADFGFGSFASLHTALESMRLAFADRDMWIGDDDVVDVPTASLLSAGYLASRSSLIHLDSRVPVALPGDPRPFDSAAVAAADGEPTGHTTHFSIIDKWGNAVAMTSTVADTFGSGIMVPGYGFELNDSLNLFNLTPKSDPSTGNPGANDAAPDKRPMGSMTPTIVVKDGEPILVTGTYGSAFIPSLVFNVVTNVVDHGMTLQQAVDAPRMWAAVANVSLPNRNFARNPGFPQETIDAMVALGDQITLKPTNGFGSTSSAGVDSATLDLAGASDKRQFQDPAAVSIPWS